MIMIKQALPRFILFLLLLCAPWYIQAEGHSVIPEPVKANSHRGHFSIKSNTVVLTDINHPELLRLAEFFCDKIKLSGGPEIKIVSLNTQTKNAIYIKLGTNLPEIGKEGYHLLVDRKSVILEANTTQGIFYGIQTLLQLMPPEIESPPSGMQKKHWKISCIEITDFPRFIYRGLHLDVCRHFFPPEFIKEYIDLLSMYKMNTFHWHLTDDQGWRIEISKYPELTRTGSVRKGTQVAKSDVIDDQPYGGFYTKDQIREIVKYAGDRYITIIPEIEMPGHAVAALAAYPQYSCTGGPFEVRTMWGVSDDVFCAGNDATYTFLQDILTEVLELFPSKYIHIGGDEAPKTRWMKCPLCQKRIKDQGLKDEHELQSYFIQRIEKFLNAKGRKIIGWDEILEGGLAPDATVMSWRGMEGGIEAARQGHDVIMTPGSHCYFDHFQADPSYEPLAIGGFTNLKKVYSFEPVPPELNETEAKHILGAQGNLWSEYLEKGSHVIYMAYPRAIALSEINWSPVKSRNWTNFVERLENHFHRLDYKGVNYCKSLYDVSILTIPGQLNNSMDVSLTTDWKDIDIRYSLDGSEPGIKSEAYSKPFPIFKSAIVKASVYKGKEKKGRINEKQIKVHKAFGKKVQLLQAYSEKYPGQGNYTVTDGLKGSVSFRAGEWQGYNGNDFEGIIDLGELTTVNSITANFMKNIYSWIHLPVTVEFYHSADGDQFTLTGTLNCRPEKIPGIEIRPFSVMTQGIITRYIKVKAVNNKVNPPWHESAGLPSWIFIDEIIVE
ncbi:MAG: beta-N-acetylhexosaminidase [Bacteroidales bacterium]